MKRISEEFYNHKVSYLNWKVYIGTFILFGTLGIIPIAMFGGMNIFKNEEINQYVFSYGIYWVIVTIIFTTLTIYQKYATFDKPLNLLCEATQRVSKGDFQVKLKPVHISHKDYLDYMFEDFNKMVEELSSIETLKNDFVADVSHEIKTPLAIIQNYITALQQDDLNQELKKEYMNIIIEATNKLSELVSNILKLNKLENQKINLDIKPYNLSRQLSECIFQFINMWEEKNIQVNVDIEERVIIEADESIVELIWNNILSNAVKFTSMHGCVTITLASYDTYVEVIISDNGVGMDEKTLKHLFDKFYQGDTSHSSEGNGLGMALVMKAIEIIHAEINVKSQLNQGTTFKIRLNKHGIYDNKIN